MTFYHITSFFFSVSLWLDVYFLAFCLSFLEKMHSHVHLSVFRFLHTINQIFTFSVYLCLSLFLFVWLVSVYSFSLNHSLSLSLSLVQSPSSIITVLWDVKVCLTTASEYLHFQQSCFCIWDWMQSLTISAVQQFYANNFKTNIYTVFTQDLHIIIFVQKVLQSVKIFLHYFHQISLKITFSWYCK